MNKVLVTLLAILVVACDGAEPPADAVVIEGSASVGQMQSGTVTAYDYSQCAKGSQLAQTTVKDDEYFTFNIAEKMKDRPVLIELSNFSYKEQWSNQLVDASESVMRSVVVIQSGELGKNVTISFWTNLSAALTAYECEGNNTKAVQQIDDSNTLLSDALSFDINEDLPLQITNLDTPAVKYRDLPTARYGIANAAVASYTLDIDIRNGGMVAHELYNSATLADLAYADILYDGFLNGVADTTVTMFGDVTLSADVYRTDIPNHMVAIINNFQSLPEGIDKKFLSGVASGFNGSSVPDLFGYGDIIPLGANAKPILRGVKVSSCSLTNAGTCCGSWTSGKETVYRSAATVEFDVQDSFSSYEVTNITSSASGLELVRGLSSNVTENVRVAWRSGLKPVIEFSQDSTGIEIRSLNVEFTNDLGEKLIVTKTINSRNCSIN